MEADCVRGPVFPDVPLRAAVPLPAERLLPAVRALHRVAFHPASAGEAHEARIQRLEHFHGVAAEQPRHAVRWHEAHAVDVEMISVQKPYRKPRLRIARRRHQPRGERLPRLPVRPLERERLLRACELDLDDCVAPQLDLEVVGRTGDGVHSEIAVVEDSAALAGLNAAERGTLLVRTALRDKLVSRRAERMPVLERQLADPAKPVLKRAVAHHLGVDASVERQVDVLEEDAPHVGSHRILRLADCYGRDVGAGNPCECRCRGDNKRFSFHA